MNAMKLVKTCAIAAALGIGAIAAAQPPADPPQQHMAGMMKPTDDASYVRMMVMHHEHGIQMAKLAEEHGQSAAVKTFAKETIEKQEKELKELRRIEQSLPTATTGRADMHKPMMTEHEQTLGKLRQARGESFDRTFIDMMISHHQMAIDMSTPPTEFKSPAVEKFARETIEWQKKDVDQLKQMQTK